MKGSPFTIHDSSSKARSKGVAPLTMREGDPQMVKLAGWPKSERDKQKDDTLKRQGEWKQKRKGTVMTCSTCELRNHNSRRYEKVILLDFVLIHFYLIKLY